ncbi:MAG: hypothetical protein GXC94_03540 [Comamonadaceae bacterium]|jgi:hypothetical protein|nr:hypothetical protein [Comamonadaceae bacterium]
MQDRRDMHPAPLRHLHFELSEGDDGVATLDAMASTRDAAQLAAIRAEAQRVQDWARRQFPQGQGPVEEGGLWDEELLEQAEAGGWTTLALTLSAAPLFVEAFLAAFGSGDEDSA